VNRFVISCGGTGGHLSPGIALAEGLVARGDGAVLLISRRRVDAELSGRYPRLEFIAMPGSGFSWSPVTLVRFLWSQAGAVRLCWRVLRRERPRAVVGFGGFTSFPLVVAARLLGVPVALHESNRVPGRAVRTLGRLARRVYLPPGVSLPGLRGDVIRPLPLPVRREIRRGSPEAARVALGLEPSRRVLAVLGGSQGAGALNAWARGAVAPLAAAGVQLYVVTGPGKDRASVVETATPAGPVRAIFEPFCGRMADLLTAADLVVSRAGAGSIAELIRCGTPAVLVPYPEAADNHQEANARWFAGEGGGVVVTQERITTLDEIVREALADEARLSAWRDTLRRLDRADPLEAMLADLDAIGGAKAGAGRTGLAAA
jgi:UDP-N-acetylglucosamine--N-acetylmuramyl-(pentapeptide) pyrophosphoryl-undecaprenol N-acetylglucosamine transferase